MGDGDDQDGRGEASDRGVKPAGSRAASDAHLAKAIAHLTMALEALDRAEVALACGYVDLALTICMDARAERAQTKG